MYLHAGWPHGISVESPQANASMFLDGTVLSSAMELEMEGRMPVGRPKKTWSKVGEEDMRKLNIVENLAEDRK